MASLTAEVLKHAKSFDGKKAGPNGECFDLAHEALTKAGAKSAQDFGKVTKDADYIWGTSVELGKVLGGDILQFRNYKCDHSIEDEITITFGKNDSFTYFLFDRSPLPFEHPHHTAVAGSPVASGKLTVWDQNIDRGKGKLEKIVRSRELYIRAQPKKTAKSTKRITINRAWGDVAKKSSGSDRSAHAAIDQIVKKYNGKIFNASVVTTTEVKVSGQIKAYRAVKK